MQLATPPSIGIAGAGVAGLVLAIRLTDAGWRPVVFEARSRTDVLSEGVFLTLAPNGMNGLRPMGLAERVAEAGVATDAIEILDERGRRLGLIDQADHASSFGADSVTLARGTLVAALVEAAEQRGIALHFGTPVTGLRDGGGAVALEVGGEWQPFDLAAACDGLRSRLRGVVMPEAAGPRFTGLIGTGGIAAMPEIAATDGTLRMVFGHAGFFGYLKSGTGPVMWFNSYPAPAPRPAGSDARAYAGELRALHRRDPRFVCEVLAQVSRVERDYPIFDVPPLESWHRGRVVLVGDAAHAIGPHAGQGASMAIEDAVLLAACLRAEPGPAAFARWESMRHGRIAEVVALTARNGSQKRADTPLARMVRRIVLPLILPLGVRTGRRLLRYRVDREPLVLKACDAAA
jgi:2-polyprenyl-6-methoxyphenol hydroxylase-like FAD-dependent oxidoreductase